MAKWLNRREELDGQSRAACRVLTARDCRPTVGPRTFLAGAALRAFLAKHNGFNLFNGTLAFFGLRKLTGRSYDIVMGQPYCIVLPNTLERPRWLEDDAWVIGTYNWDRSRVCLSPAGKLRLREPESGQLVKAWSSLERFLSSEASRLPKLFDEKGQELDEDESTLPC